MSLTFCGFPPTCISYSCNLILWQLVVSFFRCVATHCDFDFAVQFLCFPLCFTGCAATERFRHRGLETSGEPLWKVDGLGFELDVDKVGMFLKSYLICIARR